MSYKVKNNKSKYLKYKTKYLNLKAGQENITIILEKLNGEIFNIELHNPSTIRELKKAIESQEGINKYHQQILLPEGDKPLTN